MYNVNELQKITDKAKNPNRAKAKNYAENILNNTLYRVASLGLRRYVFDITYVEGFEDELIIYLLNQGYSVYETSQEIVIQW